MTLSIIAILLSAISLGWSLVDGHRNKHIEEKNRCLEERILNLENNVDKWNSYGEILGYEKGNAIHYYGVEMVPPERKLTKWNALLEYLKIEWKEEPSKARFEKKK